MKTGVLKWVWCLGLAVGLPSCSGVEEQEVVSPDRHLVVGMTELDKDEYGDVSFEVYYNGERALPLVNLGVETNRQKYAGNLKFKSVSEAKPMLGKTVSMMRHVYSFCSPLSWRWEPAAR